MSLSNYQKHGFIVLPKAFRRDKSWVEVKKFIREEKKRAIWNGKSVGSLFTGEVGRVEGIRLVETGGQF